MYSCVMLWTIALHAPLSYTTLSGAVEYLLLMLTVCTFVTAVSFEAVPVMTARLRQTCPTLADSGEQQQQRQVTAEPRLALIARAFGGSMAWLLGIALMNMLEVAVARLWHVRNADGTQSHDGAPLTYYWGGLHNVPLVARWFLCALVLGLVVPMLALLKRSQRTPLRDALVGALLHRGDDSLAALALRSWDRLRGLYLPALANTAAQVQRRGRCYH